METHETFEKLKDLQGILAKRYDLEKQLADAPNELVQQEQTLNSFKKEFIDKNEKYESVKSQVLATRLELEKTVKIREQAELGMDNVTAHREYEALYKQIEDARLREVELRKTLEFQERDLSMLDEEVQSVKSLIDPQEADLQSAKASIDERCKQLQSELDALKTEENGLTPGVDKEILFKFQRIIQRNKQGIVAVHNGVCMGCQMILPAQFSNIVRKGEEINFCPYCSRILYYEQTGDEEKGEEDLLGAGSLSDLDDADYDYDEDDDDETDDREALGDEDDDDEAIEQSEDPADVDDGM